MEVVKNKLDEDTLYAKPVGRLDINNAESFKEEVVNSVTNYKNLVIDFGEVTFISSIGLRTLFELQKLMSEKGTMKLINVSYDIMYIFNMTGFDKILNIE